MNGAQFLVQAQTAGMLDASAPWPQADARPWPVLLLTALGAWLAVIPLMLVVGMVFGPWVRQGPGLYALGAAGVALALMLLRGRGVPLFLEQLALPVLLVGLLCLGWRLHQDLPDRAAWALIALLQLGLAWPLRRPWLRMLLGAGAATLLLLVWRPSHWGQPLGLLLPALGLAVLLGLAWMERWPAAWALWADGVGAGWLLALAAALALDAGVSFLVGGLAGGSWRGDWSHWSRQGLSALAPPLVLLALALLARRWPSLARPRWVAAGVLLAGLAWVMPTLGALALLAALALRQQRARLGLAVGLAALWVLGAFYYRLDWGLQTKALGLLTLGAALAALAAWPDGTRPSAERPPARVLAESGRPWGLALSLLLGLSLVNVGIWQKEGLIASGQPVFVELAPVDPRSLMQGDFMRLDYAPLRQAPSSFPPRPGAQRPQLVLARDARGVASFRRLHQTGDSLAADELRIELSPKDGGWILVSDAWFFKEGEASRWEAARYAEFRVDAGGRALLVGLRGADLRPL